MRNLLSLNGRIFVYLRNRNISELFLKNAEAEGFTFSDGVKPTERHDSDIFALHHDRTINYVGSVGHMAFQCAADGIVRVDYEKYLAGAENYIL